MVQHVIKTSPTGGILDTTLLGNHGADPDHSQGVIHPTRPGNTLGYQRRGWRMGLRERMSELN